MGRSFGISVFVCSCLWIALGYGTVCVRWKRKSVVIVISAVTACRYYRCCTYISQGFSVAGRWRQRYDVHTYCCVSDMLFLVITVMDVARTFSGIWATSAHATVDLMSAPVNSGADRHPHVLQLFFTILSLIYTIFGGASRAASLL